MDVKRGPAVTPTQPSPIEVDGGQHEEAADAARTAVLEQEGYRVIRFWNDDVLGNPDGVWTVIDAALHGRHPTPTPPHRGEGP